VNLTIAGCAFVRSSTPSVVSNDAAGILYPVSTGTADLITVFSGITNRLTVVVTNEAPIARDDGLITTVNHSNSVSTATLVANDLDDSGGPLSVTAVSAASTNGGSVVLSSGQVTYTPLAGYTGPDLFTYTVADAYGASSTGNVFVYVVNGAIPAQGAVTIQANGGSYTVTFRGTPGTTYSIQRATAVTGPWNPISTQTVPPSGIIAITDSAPPPGQAFYKVTPPVP
jgi:hypothetical protein